jgi:hypothetical protein
MTCCFIWYSATSPKAASSDQMFSLVVTMKQGTASTLAAAAARYPTLEAARAGAAELYHNDRVLRVMVVRSEVPPAFVEWRER